MLSDLEHLIRLQQIDTATEQIRQRIEAIPSQLASSQDTLERSRATLVTAQDTLADNKRVRTDVENDLAAAQSQLSKFKEQTLGPLPLGPPMGPEGPPMEPPPGAQLVDREVLVASEEDLQAEYAAQIAAEVTAVILDHSEAILLGADDWLVVATVASFSPNDTKMMLKIRGSDLIALRARELSREDTIKRIETGEF